MSVPLQWRLKKAKYALKGTKCSGCSALFFPARNYCTNCKDTNTKPHDFSGSGTIESFTVIRAAPKGFRAPYVVALVRLKEGPLVAAQLTSDGKSVAVGSRVVAVFRKISDTEVSGVINYGFKFESV